MDAVEVGPSPAPLFRMTCALAGVDPALVAACPPRDRDGVRLLAALMMLVWLWQSAVFATLAHLMLAGPGEVRADLIAGAVLLATIILLLDAYVVMRPSWTTFGYEELRRGGLAIRLPFLARVKGGVFLALSERIHVPGTLAAAGVAVSAAAGEWPSGPLATNEPDQAVSPPTDTDPDRSLQALGSETAMLEASGGTSTFRSASMDEPPTRRKRGRPPKERPDPS